MLTLKPSSSPHPTPPTSHTHQQEVLDEPVLEVVLSPGDVLYMPRGTVHQAAASDAAPSAHVTISTHQRASYGDLALHLIGNALRCQHDEAEIALPASARRGPPPGLVFAHSLHRVLALPPGDAAGPTPGVIAGLATALRDVASKLEGAPDMLTAAAQSFASDFWRNRLPPHPEQLAPAGVFVRIFCRVCALGT